MSRQKTPRTGARCAFSWAAYAFDPTSPASSALKKQNRTVWVSLPGEPAEVLREGEHRRQSGAVVVAARRRVRRRHVAGVEPGGRVEVRPDDDESRTEAGHRALQLPPRIPRLQGDDPLELAAQRRLGQLVDAAPSFAPSSTSPSVAELGERARSRMSSPRSRRLPNPVEHRRLDPEPTGPGQVGDDVRECHPVVEELVAPGAIAHRPQVDQQLRLGPPVVGVGDVAGADRTGGVEGGNAGVAVEALGVACA